MFGGEKKADCPLWRSPCKEHGCRWYKHIIGQDPNTGQPIDRYDCAIAWLPTLLIELSLFERHTAASTDKVANEIDKFRGQMVQQNKQLGAALEQVLLEGDVDGGPR